MSVKKTCDFWNSPNIPEITTNKEIFVYYQNRLINLYMARFNWTMPETCDEWFLEKKFLESGTATLLKEKNTQEWLSVGYTYSGSLNVYGYPTNIRGVGYANYTNIEPDIFVVGFDNKARTSAMSIINLFAYLLWEIHMTYRNNLQTQNTPYIITGPKNLQLSIKNILLKLFGRAPVLELSQAFDPDTIKVLNLHVDFIGKDILENLATVWDMALAMLGIMQTDTKKERMITREVEVSQWENMITLNSAYRCRQIMIDKVNKLDPNFDWKVEIATIDSQELNFKSYSESEEDYGNIYSDDL